MTLVIESPNESEINRAIVISNKKYNAEQVKLVKDSVAKNTSMNEFLLFMYQAGKYNLDPLMKEIWCVKYRADEPASIFASFSGILKKAVETKEFDGFEDKVQWDDEEKLIPKYVEATVYRKNMAHPITFRAYRRIFERRRSDGKLVKNWEEMPYVMLRKVAIVNAVRQAFPDILGTIYIQEEMPEGEVKATEILPPRNETPIKNWETDPITISQKERLEKEKENKEEEPFIRYFLNVSDKKEIPELTKGEASKLIDALKHFDETKKDAGFKEFVQSLRTEEARA